MTAAPAFAADIEIAVGAPERVSVGQDVEIKALLHQNGVPLEGAEVAVTYQASIAGESARVELDIGECCEGCRNGESIDFGISHPELGGTVSVSTGSILDIATTTATVGPGVTLIKDGTFGDTDQLSTLTVRAGGVLTHTLHNESGLVLDVSGTMTLDAGDGTYPLGGLIDVTAKGLYGGRGGSVTS